jgi:aspartyl-tRNA(Asn)/glutamyl-tRNA(Gln) amidotransferase subunit C
VTKFTKDDIKHISKLANVPITENEEESLTQAFTQTLEYIEVLDELDTSSVNPTYQVNGLKNVFQSPNTKTTLKQSEALQNASDPVKDKFGTKAVFDR